MKNLIPKHQCLFYDSAWSGHGPFAIWLVKIFKPKIIVELGTHGGYSYFAFCQAADIINSDNLSHKVNTNCFAIDTWEGDDHSTFYNNVIYNNVKQINDENYAEISTLVRKRFIDAVELFADKSIDLLHIDGRHGYADVKDDFETYMPKLSDNAIVLFHDTKAYKPGFGVYKYFAELSEKYKTAEFDHSSGLGILFFGKNYYNTSNLAPELNTNIQNLCNKKSFIYNLLAITGIKESYKINLARYKLNYNKIKIKYIKKLVVIQIKYYLFILRFAMSS